jgi:ribose transport system permease protein
MTSAVLARPRGQRGAAWQRLLVRNGWALGVWLLLGALLFWYANLIPAFGSFQIASISKNSLPLVYLAIGQAIIVIAGGIDLSLGPLLLLGNVIAARFMDGQPFGIVLLIALAIIAGLAILNALTGYLISISGMPDIVVTLATSYIWSGVALWILPSPGGGTAPEFRWLFTGSQAGIGGSYIVPLVMMAIPAIAVFIFSRRSRLGLSMYAIGSSSVAARLAGLDIRRVKIASYATGGAMAALAGLATVAITGTGDPRFSIGANATLNSVAAIVLGGGINANTAQVIQGALIAGVMMIGGLVALVRERSS